LTPKYTLLEDKNHILKFEILYWAAFLGKNYIVEALIRSGYSPIIKNHRNLKNAVFGCVLGD
jgi:hypothetical protein